nr:hypothetical protein [Tanacetum cinerariifolium]
QGCALLRERLEEDLVSYLKYFYDTSETFDDSTNVVNAPREPFVVKQDHGVKSSQNPPPIDKCCCECGNALDGIFCQQCICKSCGKGAMLKMVTIVHLNLNLIIQSRVTVKTLISRRIFTIFNNSISVVISVGARTKLFNVNSLEAAEIVISEVEEIEDDNLREKLSNVYLLIANIEALKDNPTQSSELLTKHQIYPRSLRWIDFKHSKGNHIPMSHDIEFSGLRYGV